MESTFENSLESLVGFWKNSSLQNISNIALRLLTASGSSSRIETAFSQSSMSFGPRRTRLQSSNLEKETLMRYNKDMLD